MIQYRLEGDVAILGMDDGKANAIGHAFIDAFNESLDRAEKEAKALVILGRAKIFSAGFDLKEFAKGQEATVALVRRGAEMFLRVFSFGLPVVAACQGHAVAGGAIMLMASDTRIGGEGEYNVCLNETSIGMVLPSFGMEMAKCRLASRFLTAAVLQSQVYTPEQAVEVGFLDQVVPVEELEATALQQATKLTELPQHTYAQCKLELRKAYIKRIKSSLEEHK